VPAHKGSFGAAAALLLANELSRVTQVSGALLHRLPCAQALGQHCRAEVPVGLRCVLACRGQGTAHPPQNAPLDSCSSAA
jgi:hypothetical protein